MFMHAQPGLEIMPVPKTIVMQALKYSNSSIH